MPKEFAHLDAKRRREKPTAIGRILLLLLLLLLQVQEVQVQVPVPAHEVQVQVQVQEVQVPVQVQSTIAQNFIILNISQKSLVSLIGTE